MERTLVGWAKAHRVERVLLHGPLRAFAHAVRPRRLTAWAKSREARALCRQLRQATLPTLRCLHAIRHERELPMTSGLPRMGHALAGAIVLTALCCAAAFLPVFAAEAPATGPPPNLDLSAPAL